MENNFKIDESLLLDGSEKVGDTIWTIYDGDSIYESENSSSYPIRVGGYTYTKLGYRNIGDLIPHAFKRNPFASQYPKMMEVSSDNKEWAEDRIMFYDDGHYWTIYESMDGKNLLKWKHAREIQPKAVEFSEEQIKYLKDKFNVNV